MASLLPDIVYPGLGFAVVCLAVTTVSLRLPAFRELDWETRFFCALCCGALVNCSVVSWPALAALQELYDKHGFNLACDGASINLLHLPAPPNAVLACGLTCGYFLQDSLLLLLYPKETEKGLGGRSAYKIMWMHHVLSLLVWPYALVKNLNAVFVTYFLATEITNIGQNIFLIASRSRIFGSGLDLPIGIAWAFTFLVARVLPVPFIVYAYVRTLVLTPGGCGMETYEYLITLVTVPIPIALNLFWFYKIVSKARRMISKKKK